MATADPWLEFDQIRHSIKNNTVDRLKHILAGFNEECGMHFTKAGKKQEIIDRIVNALDNLRATTNEDRWNKAKAIVYQVRNTGRYTPGYRIQSLSAGSTTFDPPKASSYAAGVSGTSNISHYDPYAPPRRPNGVSAPVASSSNGAKAPPIRFRDSPFFAIDQAVTSVVECPESNSHTDRRQQSLAFTLNADQMTKMRTAGTNYQLRLFCTSSIFYAGTSTFRTNPVPCPVEFPPTCELRVNNATLSANLKGLKKKPGTAPPPDLSKFSRFTGANRVEMVYVNSQQPVQAKKYYMIVMLVEATNVDAIVEKLKTQHLKSAQEIQQTMLQSMSEDDDIIAGPQKMSLKCPLTFMRIGTPCRSSKCVHPQCFDATSWFTMMEQTTTWLCPVCERVLDHKDLIVDGYFDEILKQTPESVEDVIVEADGQWHTSDNKHGSAQWMAAHVAKAAIPVKPALRQSPTRPSVQPATNGSGQANGKGKAPDVEIFILDSDEDEDEGRVKRELSPSYASSARESLDSSSFSQTQTQSSTVIDLTLDDSDDEQPPAQSNFGKRKATEANLDAAALPEQLWKKGRIDSSRILPPPRPSGSSTTSILPSSPSGFRFSSSFLGNTLPPPVPGHQYPNGRSGTATSSQSLQLPPLSSLPSRPTSSHHSGWS